MAFVNLEQAELIDFKVYIPRLQDWFWRLMGDLYKSPSASLGPAGGVLMGLPLWGDDFIDRFCFFCLPSLRAKKNWQALAGRSRLLLFTDGPGFLRLFQVARDLEAAGMKTDVYVIPPEIMEHLPKSPLNRYWLLGTCGNYSLQVAGRGGMGFHMLMPDHLYGPEYFENMWRLAATHDAIAQTGISADIVGVLSELEQFRQEDGSLVVPDVELGDLGYRHLHKQTAGNFMNDRDINTELPDSHFMFWQGKDRLHLFCCHMNAAWMSPRMCSKAPIRLYNALDTELPNFMGFPNGEAANIAIPEAHDGMTFIELSDDKKIHATHRVNFTDWAVRCWTTVHWGDGHMPFFRIVNEVPIKPRETYVEKDLIIEQHRALCEGLVKIKEPLKVEWEAKKAERAAITAAEKVLAKPTPVLGKSKRALKRQRQALMRHKQNGAAYAHAGAG